jgi:hypothetical protein
MKKIIRRTFKKMPQASANSFASVVCQRMTDDARFADLMPYVKELKMRNNAFETAAANAADGGRTLIRLKNECLDAMLEQLDYVTDHVEMMAKGDEKVALAAGFELVPEAKPITDLEVPSILSIENLLNRTGMAKVTWQNIRGAVSYGLEHKSDADTEWKNGTYATGSSGIIANLPANTFIHVRMYAIGRGGMKSDVSDAVGVLVS